MLSSIPLRALLSPSYAEVVCDAFLVGELLGSYSSSITLKAAGVTTRCRLRHCRKWDGLPGSVNGSDPFACARIVMYVPLLAFDTNEARIKCRH